MRKSKLNPGLLFLLFGIHLSLPLAVGGAVLVPEILVSGFLLVTGYIFRVALQKSVLLSLACVAFLSALTIVFSPDWSEHFVAHIRSSLNLIFSLLIALAFLFFLKYNERQIDVFFNLKVFVCIALAFSIMEITEPFFTSIIDTFRYAVFPDDRIYTAEWRDVELFGFKRPTFFGNEPSYLGITLATLAVCLSIYRSDLRSQILAVSCLVLGVLIVRSPTALPIALIIPVVFFANIIRGRVRKWQWFVLLQFPVLLVLCAILILDVFGARIELALAGEDNSTDIRLVKPVEAAWLSVSQSPLVGMGVGGRDKLSDDMLSYSDWSRHTSYVFARDRISNFFATGTFLIFTESGLMALVILVAIFRAFHSVLPQIKFIDFILCFILISVTMGGWTHPRLWLLIGLVLFFFNYKRENLSDKHQLNAQENNLSFRRQD